jgi:hypothetical protein
MTFIDFLLTIFFLTLACIYSVLLIGLCAFIDDKIIKFYDRRL